MKAVDTYINAARPTTNYFRASKLGLKKWDAADAQYAFVNFPLPFKRGVRIVSATLSFHTYAMPEGGTHSITVSAVTSGFSYARGDWSDRPTVDSARQITEERAGALPGGYLWEFNVKAMMQRVSDGHSWLGFRITTNDAPQRWVYSESLYSGEGPTLTVVWADNPDIPDSLSPDNGVVSVNKPALSFDYVDLSGDLDLSKVHVQISTSATFSTITWDSGEIDAIDGPTVYLSKTTYPGAVSGQKVYWRVRVMDGAGLWCKGWSYAADFTYLAPEGITPTSFDPASPKFSDVTPDISWTSPNQTAYQVTIARTSNPSRILYNTGKVYSTKSVIGIPPKVLRWEDVNYRVIIRTWDNQKRVGVANALPYNRVQYDVMLDSDLSVTPVTSVTHAQVNNTPFVEVVWDRPTSADAYEIARQLKDGQIIILDKVLYADTIQPNGRHKWVDYTAPPNTPLRYIVRPFTNGKRGPGKPSTYSPIALEGIWLFLEGSYSLFISGGGDQDVHLVDRATSYDVIGSDAPILIREGYRGYAGTITGTLDTERRFQSTRSAQEKKNVFLFIKKRPVGARVAYGDLNIPVDLSDMDVTPKEGPVQRYDCSFHITQNDEIWEETA